MKRVLKFKDASIEIEFLKEAPDMKEYEEEITDAREMCMFLDELSRNYKEGEDDYIVTSNKELFDKHLSDVKAISMANSEEEIQIFKGIFKKYENHNYRQGRGRKLF